MKVNVVIEVDDIGEFNNPIVFIKKLVSKALKEDEDFQGKILSVKEGL